MATVKEGLCAVFSLIWSKPGGNSASACPGSYRLILCLKTQRRWREVTGAENARQRKGRWASQGRTW